MEVSRYVHGGVERSAHFSSRARAEMGGIPGRLCVPGCARAGWGSLREGEECIHEVESHII